MPILSYIAHPQPDRDQELRRELEAMPECSVMPAERGSLLVLVTDTESEAEETGLQERLKAVDSLAFLSLVFAHEGDAS